MIRDTGWCPPSYIVFGSRFPVFNPQSTNPHLRTSSLCVLEILGSLMFPSVISCLSPMAGQPGPHSLHFQTQTAPGQLLVTHGRTIRTPPSSFPDTDIPGGPQTCFSLCRAALNFSPGDNGCPMPTAEGQDIPDRS